MGRGGGPPDRLEPSVDLPGDRDSGSISQARARASVPKATLSRKLRQLEQQIGAVLLKRGPHIWR